MKAQTPRQLALILAGVLFAVFLLILSILLILNPEEKQVLLFGVVSAVLVFVLVYLITHYIIEKFIYSKIKVIYKTIHNLKVNKSSIPEKLNMQSDILNQVNQEVVQWAISSKKEIEQLKNQEEYRKEFIGNVSHELKTPIFNIQGYILTLLEGGLEDEKINREYLQRAERSVERMINIVEDLDIVTKLESGQMTMEYIKFDIVELIRDVCIAQEINSKKKGITFKIKTKTDKPVFVNADKDRIRQVLTNLVINSIKYGKEGGETEISFYDMEENILVEISDNGIGIPKEHLPRLFERFYRVDKSRSRESGGSGLGLSIVKHIIEAHNQTIDVRSTEGVGSTFSFTLLKTK